MGDIYKNSTLTIAAANGDHADSGLFKVRDPRECRPCPFFKYKNEQGQNTQVFACRPTLNFHHSPLDTRAWTFQEEMLSTRTLKFGPGFLRWSCVTISASEEMPMGNQHSPIRLDHQMRQWIHCPSAKPPWHEALDPRRFYYEDWYSVVEHYSTRKLTIPDDKLPALSGLAMTMEKLRCGTYLAGLWKEDLEYGLLWYVRSFSEKSMNNSMTPGGGIWNDTSYRVGRKDGKEMDTKNIGEKTPFGDSPSFWLDSQDVAKELSFITKNLQISAASSTESTGTPDPAIIPPGTPSWSWASLENAAISFLYSQHGLAAGGAPRAKGLQVICKPKHNELSVYGEISSGALVLKGALDWVFLLSNPILGWNRDYQTPSMMMGRWTAEVFCPMKSEAVGFAALDEDPEITGLGNGIQVAIFLLRHDDEETPERQKPSPSGRTGTSSYLPLAFNHTNSGHLLLNHGKRRWTSCLLLREVDRDKQLFRRVGLCQLYHSFWGNRLDDEGKRQRIITIV